ncbi:hypothetical protein A5707_18875 [Mycobacterium kyorinense]|uniref:YncE family protein n=2 Tax=Mycobacterium kyorinense TaxID=487514 RepID=A0A1A2ZAD4_9MYCO|nr:hypothetical protein A5707_18875 [Mycobacterium kyorinense]
MDVGTALSFAKVGEIRVHRGPISGIAVSPEGRLMVTNYGADSVSSIDAGSAAAVRTLTGLDEPFAIAVAGRRAYVSTVTAAYDAIVAVDIDTNRVVGVHPVACSVRDLAASPTGERVYAGRTAVGGADLAVLDTGTGHIDAIGIAATAGTSTECVRVSPDGRRVYVATNGASSGKLAVVDTHEKRVVDTVEIGSPIRDVAPSWDGSKVYVASCGPDFGAVVDVVDTRTNMVAATSKVAEINGLLVQLALSRDGARAYLVDDERVTVLNTHTHDIVTSIAVAGAPSCAVESPDGSHLYVADYAGKVTVFTVASTAAALLMADDEPTAPHEWVLPELLQLEPAMT